MTDNSVFENKTAAYYTLGCKLNFAETSSIGRSLLSEGVRTAGEGERADICVINTCSVTELADKKCRYMIRRAQREHPGSFVVVTGCYAQLKPEEVVELEGVNLVVGGEQKLSIVEHLRQMGELRAQERLLIAGKTEDIKTFRLSSSSDERTRHFLKVQDGCDYSCSYCTIPAARGRSRNGSIAEIVAEAERIVSEGGLEIVLTGVNTGDFGRTTGERFIDLLRALDAIEGTLRIRISSIEPNLLSEEIVDYCAQSQRIAPHFHIPLQSGSDAVLRLMRRRYNRELFSRRVAYIRERMPDAFIGIDVIVGTRGETEEYWQECYDYLSALPYSELHVFTYSERPGTAALDIAHSVPVKERHRRSQTLQALSIEKLRAFYEAQLGKPQRVLWEMGQDDAGYMSGYSDNYLRVGKPYDAASVGQVEYITPHTIAEHRLLLV
ncbi:MAG: tRNA (N(6)-L-threonylcarbamoyladenosine(37)-C(2))-methylthiotransferase MtaB [Porphyromonas sp.]|nr:tRNA (N(6)-L-threonylcarbamoyladenosine(37)-C(2))-methylthiotransferase MtaB [Porphyromonas sp.]